jgi:hypothetical protein
MDNIYKEETVITAKADSECKLIITRYLDRIYYCKAREKSEWKLF